MEHEEEKKKEIEENLLPYIRLKKTVNCCGSLKKSNRLKSTIFFKEKCARLFKLKEDKGE